jgi:stalled ribosome rescue protein Dom34
MDHQHAKIFELHPGKVEAKLVEAKHHEHHTHHSKELLENLRPFFSDLCVQLKSAKEILISGPGLAKEQFRHFLESEHGQNISKQVVGVETVDHPTDAQILALARKFFKARDVYE